MSHFSLKPQKTTSVRSQAYVSFLGEEFDSVETQPVSVVASEPVTNHVNSRGPLVAAASVGLTLVLTFAVSPMFALSSSSETGMKATVAAQNYTVSSQVSSQEVDRDSYSATELKTATFTSPAGLAYTYYISPNATVQWPFTTSYPISSGFGARTPTCNADKTICGSSFHQGADFAVAAGTPIEAIADGTVIESVDSPTGLGSHVVIEHDIDGHKVTTFYGHMTIKSEEVKKGDVVKRGQEIGLVGDTGTSFGDHLHFGVQVDGIYVDPIDWLKSNTQLKK